MGMQGPIDIALSNAVRAQSLQVLVVLLVVPLHSMVTEKNFLVKP